MGPGVSLFTYPHMSNLTVSRARATRGLAAALLLALPTLLVAELPPLIPMRDFFRNPETTGYAISPNGEYLAFLAPWENRLNIHVQKIGETEATRITDRTDRDIFSYQWVNDNRLVYAIDRGGDENTRLIAVDRDGGNPLTLTPDEGVRAGIVDVLRDDPQHLIVQHNERLKQVFDVFKVDVDTGELTSLLENPGDLSSFTTDHEGVIRMAVRTNGVDTTYLYRTDADSDWEELFTTNYRDSLNVLQFTYDNEQVYALSNLDRDKLALVVYDPEANEEVEEIFVHPQVDLLGATFSDKQEKLLAVSFAVGKRYFVYFDDAFEAMMTHLQSELPDVEVRLADVSLDETKFLLRTFSDKSLGAYYHYDATTQTLTKLVEISPWLNQQHLADLEPVVYESRDGLFIHGYLMLPRGVAPENLPTVIYPHGGPWARDYWSWNATMQFLANRGYAVFEPNYRGSTGFGKRFLELGFNQLGRKMQDDKTDAVKWLIDQGIADPDRVAIYGGSYGGYAALAGLTFTPEVYAAGISYVGVSNWFTWFDAIPPYWKPYKAMIAEMFGDPENDPELMRSVSPYFHVEQIEDPLLVAQGANDPRVTKEESDQIVSALREKGIDVPYMVKTNEGHGFANEENRFDFYRAMEQFLGKHLGGRVEEGEDILSGLYEAN